MCIYIYKVSHIHSFFVIFTVMFFLHCVLNILRYEKIFCENRLLQSTIHQVMWYFQVFIVNAFSFLSSIFFSTNLCFLWSPCLFLIAESISLDISGKLTMGFFLKITSPTWIILSILLDELNLIDWLFKSWWWIFPILSLFYCCKRILIWQKILEVSWRIYLNIIFWILLWMLTTLVIWNLNITVSTTLKYCYK